MSQSEQPGGRSNLETHHDALFARRRLLQAVAATTAYFILPTSWDAPSIQLGVLPAHAFTTGVTEEPPVGGTGSLLDTKDIVKFSLLGVNGVIAGTNISVMLPFGTDVTSLVPTIEATGIVVPASGVAQDFTGPVVYTVTALDKSTKAYTVAVSVAASSAKDITKFRLLSYNGVIVETNITVVVPYLTNVSNLAPLIEITGASVSPASGVGQNFESPVIYTVTAADGSTQEYTVTVTHAPYVAKEITLFQLLGASGIITDTNISVTVPFGTNVSSLAPTIVITGVSVEPQNGSAQNFTNPVIYTVLGADLSKKVYTVTVTVAPNNAKDITSFKIGAITGVITGTNIAVTVPFGTDVTNLVPTIVITGASVSPGTGVAQNFTNPVPYTVTAADSTTKVYTVTVTVAAFVCSLGSGLFHCTSSGVIDPANHKGYIESVYYGGAMWPQDLTCTASGSTTETCTGRAPFRNVSGGCSGSLTGNGQFAGYNGVSCELMNIVLAPDGQSFTADYHIGGNGALPGGLPITYKVAGTK